MIINRINNVKRLSLKSLLFQLLITLAAILLNTQSVAEDLLSTIQLALENNLDLKSAEANLSSTDYARLTARGDYLPSITAKANTAWNENKTFNNPGSNDENKYNSYGYSISLSQKIIDLSTYHAYSLSRDDYTIENLKYTKTRNKVITDVLESYIDYLKKLARKRASDIELKSANKRHYEITKNHARGNVAKSAVYESQAKKNRTETDIIKNQKELNIAVDRIFELTRVYTTPSLDVDPNMEILLISDEKEETYTQSMLDNNIDILVAKALVDRSDTAIQQEKSKFAPTLNLSINHNINHSGNDTANVAPLTGKSADTVYTLDLSMPIFSGGKNYYGYKKAYQKKSKAELDKENEINKTRFKLRRSIFDINSNAESIVHLKSSIYANKSSYRGIKKAFETGTRTLSDVQSAEKLLFDSVRDYYDTYYDYVINLIKLQDIQGDLSIDDIRILNNKMVAIDLNAPLAIPTEHSKQTAKQ